MITAEELLGLLSLIGQQQARITALEKRLQDLDTGVVPDIGAAQ